VRSESSCLVRLWPVAVGLISNVFAQSSPSDGLYRHYAGRRDPLDLDRTRIAVQCKAEATGQNLLVALRDQGVLGTAAVPTGVPRWHLIVLRDPLTDVVDLRSRIDRAVQAAPVQFGAPVFRGIQGAFVTVTPDLLLCKQPGPFRTLDVLRELVPTAEVIDAEFGGMTGALRGRSRSRNGLDVLLEANRMAADPRIAWAEPDWQFSVKKHFIPNDPGWSQLWGMLNTGQFSGVAGMDMDCDLAWDITTGTAGVLIAVLDDGVQQDHPDINQLPGADFTGQGGGGAPVNACDDHGTAVAGCISAIINNGLGTVGTAPTCRSISARTVISTVTVPCTPAGTVQASWTVNALAFAQNQGARVTNNSNGYGFTSAAIDAQYAATYAAGIVHFASAGNDSSSTTIAYPASLAVVNAVSAIASDGSLAGFSNFGTGIDFSAPGENVYSTDRTGAAGYYSGDYGLMNGTSFASPYVAGIAALVLSQTPNMTAPNVELALRGARDRGAAGYDTTYGWGFVNANSALRSIPYGAGLGGAGGFVPQLFAGGILCIGNVISVAVDRALGGSVAAIGVGNAPAAIPVLGGTLLVSPPLVLSTVGLGGLAGIPGAGSGAMNVSIPNSPSLVNASVYLQAAVLDNMAPQGVALSNGLQIRIGPGAPSPQGAVLFDQVTDTIRLTNQTDLGTAATFEAVVWLSNPAIVGNLFNEWTNNAEDKRLWIGPNTIGGYGILAQGAVVASTAVTTNAWHHVAYVYGAPQQRLYLDGVLVATAQTSGGGFSNASGLGFLGGSPHTGATNSFLGYMTSFRISNVARYAGAGFMAPTGNMTADANTLVLFNFGEAFGSTQVMDLSGNNNHGTLGVGFAGATSPVLGF